MNPVFSTPSQRAEQMILDDIRSGRLAEGARLPNTSDLAARLKIGVNSVQQALARLSTLGYLERRPRMGTFVRHREGKALHVLLLIGPDLKREVHYYDRRLTSCLEAELTAAGYVPHVHDNLTHLQWQKGPAREHMVTRLLEDFAMYDPAGLIESSAVFKRLRECAAEFSRPTVAIKSIYMGGDVCMDRNHFVLSAVQRLADQGCKRLAWIPKVTGTSPDSHRFDSFWKAIGETSLKCVDILEVNDQDPLHDPETIVTEKTRQWIREQRTLPPARRADCLLVDEDILMRGVALALLSEQVAIPKELVVSAMTNEGVDFQFGVPVIAYENPISEIARQAVELLTARILRKDQPKGPIQVPCRVREPKVLALR